MSALGTMPYRKRSGYSMQIRLFAFIQSLRTALSHALSYRLVFPNCPNFVCAGPCHMLAQPAFVCYHKYVSANHLSSFFWDVDINNFNPQSHPHYTIARLLEYGDLEAISWLKEQFSEDAIKDVIRTERNLSPRAATFWALVYHIPAEEISALKN